MRSSSKRIYGKSKVKETLANYVSKDLPFLSEDVEKGAIHDKTAPGNTSVQVYTVTSKLAEGCILRNWFWIKDGVPALVNTEIRFKMNFKTRRQEGLAWSTKEKLNSSSKFVPIGGGLTRNDLEKY